MSSFGGHPDFSGQTIDGGKLNLSHKIGQGGFSVVYSATDKHGRAFAAKWLGIPRTLGSSLDPRCRGLLLARFDEEIKCHKLVSDHPNVVTLHRVVEDRARDGRWLVLDLYDGDLFDVLVRRNFLWQNAEHTRSAAEQIVDAVAHCHKRAVFHRDIKPENILCSRDGRRFVLADFGAATTRRYASDWRLGTLSYRAPGVYPSL
jgi:serine/threonine protein kinase